MYECNDEVMSILPLSTVLEAPSCDAYWGRGTVATVMEEKRADDWYPAVVESIRRDGFVKGITVNPITGMVQDGHHRIAAAEELGLAFIPVEEGYYADYDGEFFTRVKSGEFGEGIQAKDECAW